MYQSLRHFVERFSTLSRPYQVTAVKSDRVQQESSAWELFTCDVWVYDVEPDKVKHEGQRAEFGPYFPYLPDCAAPLAPKETIGMMSHYFGRDDVLYRLYLPVHLRKLTVPQELVSVYYMRATMMQCIEDTWH